MTQRLNLSIELGNQTRSNIDDLSEDQQLSIVVLGSFADGASIGNMPEASLHPVDIDRFDHFMAQMNPTLEITPAGWKDELKIDFATLEDFHPDRLYERLMFFQSPPNDTPPSDIPVDGKPNEVSESDQQTLARLLGKHHPSGEQASVKTKKAAIESIVKKLAAASSETEPRAVSESDPRQPETDSALMRQLLHHASFQTLESRWRGLDWLLRNIEGDENFQLYVMNLSPHALLNNLQRDRDIHQTVFFRLIRNQFTEGSSSEHKLILIYDGSFSPAREKIALLEALGSLAESLDAALIAAADDCFADTGNDAISCDLTAWDTFRKTGPAGRITLALPRILLRLPYGRSYDPIDAFPFEELDLEWRATDLLWGNPAYALAILLAARRGTNHSKSDPVLTDCPAFAFNRDNEPRLQPCTEHLYNEGQIQRLLNLGLVPVIGSRRSNTIQLPWLQAL